MDSMTIAKTILGQLGGGQFKAMTGAKNFRALETGLSFQLPDRKVKAVRISLDANDTYSVAFVGPKGVDVANFEGVYCDQLRGIFEQSTGLRTSLTRRFR